MNLSIKELFSNKNFREIIALLLELLSKDELVDFLSKKTHLSKENLIRLSKEDIINQCVNFIEENKDGSFFEIIEPKARKWINKLHSIDTPKLSEEFTKLIQEALHNNEVGALIFSMITDERKFVRKNLDRVLREISSGINRTKMEDKEFQLFINHFYREFSDWKKRTDNRLDEILFLLRQIEKHVDFAKKHEETNEYTESKEKIGIFVDTQNLYHAAKDYYFAKVNYEKLYHFVSKERQIIKAVAYVINNPGVDQSKFINVLKQCGFEVRKEDLIVRGDGTAKGNTDVDIVMDIMQSLKLVDTIVLISGDGDFATMIQRIKNEGKRVEVYGFPQVTSLRLKEIADQYIPIGEEILLREE